MENRIGEIVKINGNVIRVRVNFPVIQNEIGYVILEEERLKAEVIRIDYNYVDMQVFENTAGIKIKDKVIFTNELLSVDLGPGLLGGIFDGLGNPLTKIANMYGFFLKRGVYLSSLDDESRWEFFPLVKKNDIVMPGSFLGFVNEKIFKHYIMVPFNFPKNLVVEDIYPGEHNLKEVIAVLKDKDNKTYNCFLKQRWPVKIPIKAYQEKLKPSKVLPTKIRIIDSLFPIALGGTYCIPGPFGSGKTVLQQLISRHADVDIVVLVACGERAGEVVEVLKTFPQLKDGRTNRPLIDRTVIICNTSAMPVSARDASVYIGITIAEYYRQMGLDVLLLADSTSRWAQAMREVSTRLEEIPGEEAFPAYLESRIASFYERSGFVKLYNGEYGSVTIGGTVSPAGGNFEEPVTQATLKVVGAFLGLSRDRANARKYPAIDPLISWSKYDTFLDPKKVKYVYKLLHSAKDIEDMTKVVGLEGISLVDYITYLKGEFFDFVYLQQNAFDVVDEATDSKRQEYVFNFIFSEILDKEFNFSDKDSALSFFQKLRQLFKTWNSSVFKSDEFLSLEEEIKNLLKEKYVQSL